MLAKVSAFIVAVAVVIGLMMTPPLGEDRLFQGSAVFATLAAILFASYKKPPRNWRRRMLWPVAGFLAFVAYYTLYYFVSSPSLWILFLELLLYSTTAFVLFVSARWCPELLKK